MSQPATPSSTGDAPAAAPAPGVGPHEGGPVLTATGDHPLVGVVMGSDSDWPTMLPAVEALAEFGIEAEVGVVSAHRMPEDMVAYGRSASSRGLRVIIAGAGGAAHLPGMLAALTELPVIGVPVPLRHFDGVDSLLSIVQMPAGVPVATVSVGGARNAGLLAARILGAGGDEGAAKLRARMRLFQADLRGTAMDKGAKLRDVVLKASSVSEPAQVPAPTQTPRPDH